jgi:hypothetical protein
VDITGSRVAVMFRNWLKGSRDLYVMISENAGKSFGSAEKLGMGTWKLDACPMDGGGLGIDVEGKIHTVWRREGVVYYCNPQSAESSLTRGRDCSIVVSKNGSPKILTALQDRTDVKLVDFSNKNEIRLGKGTSLSAVLLSNKEALCTWEVDKKIKFRKIEI